MSPAVSSIDDCSNTSCATVGPSIEYDRLWIGDLIASPDEVFKVIAFTGSGDAKLLSCNGSTKIIPPRLPWKWRRILTHVPA